MTEKILLPAVTKPGRYLGHEYNSVQKTWTSADVHFALIFPDLYEVGMSHQGLQILYHILNNQDNILAERCYCPDIDAEKILIENNQAITSLESRKTLTDFDIICITLPYELCYTNILTLLNVAQIPFYSRDRDTSYPLIIGGGAGSFNPEPVADFFDAILLGDGEEAVLDIAETINKLRGKKLSKPEILEQLAQIDGIYVPSHFQPEYNQHGHVTTIHRKKGGKDTIARRILADINQIDHLLHPIVPNAKIVHDRMGIEVARGCTRGCRFCQAGITYRPVRERSPEKILELAKTGIKDSGFNELALLSLSTGDYSCLEQILPILMDTFADDFVSVAMPSMRVGTLTPSIMDQIKRVRKTGFTLAPEAGSERLRRVINKGITEEDLIATCRDAFALGWKVLKLYFMIGLPTETEQDINAITDLIKKTIVELHKGQARGKKQVNISVGTFVPKPHTPFQWEKQLTMEESTQYIYQLRNSLPRKGAKLRYHSPQLSYLEGVFSRGDRRLANLIETAWRLGARLDGWDEHFSLRRWQEAAEKCQLNLDDYLRQRNVDEILPWQHLQTGVDLQFLKDELKKAQEEAYTPDCRYHACQKCGLCDFKSIQPIVINRSQEAEDNNTDKTERPSQNHRLPASDMSHFKYMVRYSRTGDICYLGHLEILQVVFRSLRRAEIVTHFSQGFNPSPKISFGPALPVGTESLDEFFIMDLLKPLKHPESTVKKLNNKLPPGLKIFSIELHSGRIAQNMLVSYTLTLDRPWTEQEKEISKKFIDSESYPISKTRKGKTGEIDIRPLIKAFKLTGTHSIALTMVNAATQPGIKPVEALKAILHLENKTIMNTKILKTGWINMDAA